MAEFQKKSIILKKKINNIIYEIMPKTHAKTVYVDDEYKLTLTEKLLSICELLTNNQVDIDNIKECLDKISLDINENVTEQFKEVWKYLNINGEPESELIKLIKSKQDSEDGKGLSTNDFTDLLLEKLESDYTKEELTEKFTEMWDNFLEKTTEIDQSIKELDEKIDSSVKDMTDALKEEKETRENADDDLAKKVSRHNTYMSPIPPSDEDGVEDNTTWYQVIE